MSDKIKENEKIETKNLESIPSKNDLPDVKSKEHYEKLVIERRLNSYEKSKNAQETSSSEDAQEVSTEDLNDVAGGKGQIRRLIDRFLEPPVPKSLRIPMDKYAGPPSKFMIPKSLTPEEWKKIKERKKEKERN